MPAINLTTDTHWTEHPDHALPAGLLEIGEGGNISVELTGLRVRMSARAYPDGPEHHFHSHLADTLLEVFEKAAQTLQKPLLPPAPAKPLDFLRLRRHDGRWSEPIVDLGLPLWKALADGFSRHVGVEYRLIVRINTKWGVPTSEEITPRLLLTEFGFDPAQFSLYKSHSNIPLPPDTPVKLERGEHFEAQKDGRYGGGNSSVLVRGLQTLEEDVERLRSEGAGLLVHRIDGQRYVEARLLDIPCPPWSSGTANILVAAPDTFPQGGLDAFYLESGVTQNGAVPRQQSTAGFLGRSWSLISWHYANNRPWDPLIDDLGTHIEHCRGFFLARGVTP
jgi:hypothetical protein